MQRTILFVLALVTALCGFSPSSDARAHRHAHYRHFHFRTHHHRHHLRFHRSRYRHNHSRYRFFRSHYSRHHWFRRPHSWHHHHHWRFRHHAWFHAARGRHFMHALGGGSGGLASWYSGRRTASGERFRGGGFTAAHPYYPFGTRVRVTNQSTGRSVVVRINDRGPFVRGRVIDLSRSAARAVGISGVGRVSLRRL